MIMKNNRNLEYQMSKTMFVEILKTRKGLEEKMNPQDYVAKFLNEQGDFLGTVTRVHVYNR